MLMDDRTAQALEALAAQLNTTVEHLWRVLVTQAPINAALDLAAATLFMSLAVWISIIARRTWRENSYGDAAPLWIALAVVVWVVTVIFCMVAMHSAVTALLNPEFWALKQLLSR